MADSRLEQLSKTDRNPSEESEYRSLLEQSGLGYYQGGNTSTTGQFRAAVGYGNTGGGYGGASDFTSIAKKALEFQQQANKPAIETLQGQIDPLKQRYTDLLNSIKGQQTVAENLRTLTTSNALGRRGITGGG